MSSSNIKAWQRLLFGTALFGFVFVSLSSAVPPVRAATGINQQLNFQGRLLNSAGATVPDGVYNVEFKIYQDGDGQSVGDTTGSPAGTLKWTEDHLNNSSQGVTVRNGYLSVQLGSITAFGTNIDWNQDTLWLSVNIGNTNGSCTPFSSCSPDGEMIPMKRLSANPYALNAGQLGGLTSSQYVQLARGLQSEAGNSTNSIDINKTGTGGNFIRLQASGSDAFTLNNSGDIAFGANANHTISVATAGASAAGKSLTITAGTAGSGGSALVGGDLVLQAGTGGGTNGNGGNITIDAGAPNGSGSGGTINIGTANASGVNIATNASAHTVAIGNGAAVQSITIGSTNSTSSLLLQAGTGNLSIQTQGGTLGIGDNAVAQTIQIGNSTGATSVSVDCGTGNCLFGTTSTVHTTTVGSVNGASTTTLQAGTGGINIGTGGIANTVQIGSTTLSSGTQTINLGTNNVAGGTTNVTIGSGSASASGSTTVRGKDGVTFSTNGVVRGTFGTANDFYFGNGASAASPNNFTIQGTASTTTAVAGGSLTIQGGNATVGNANGGNITVDAGAPFGTGNGGTVNIGTVNAATVQIGSTTLSSGTQTINLGTNNTSGGTTNVVIGSGSASTAGTTTVRAKTSITLSTNGVVRSFIDTSNNIFFGNGSSNAAPNNFTIQGTASTTTAVAGGTITLQGGNANTGNANGGDLSLNGGAGIGSGVSGLVKVGAAAFSSVTNTTCAANCTLTQANIDTYSTIVVNSSTAGITMTLPDPTTTTVNGRIIYIVAANGSSDFVLESNSGGSLIDIAMRQNATATMVWNGTDWTAAGASNATTLQATYNNGTNPSTTPEIKLDSTHGTIDIQDADTTIGADLFNIRASNAGNLGTVLLGVGNNGTVTIRNSTDQQAAFRFQNAASRYVLNVNTNSNYFINNGTRASGNDIINPGFEAGTDTGDTTFGEQGWFGSAQAVSVNSSSNAHSGNYELQVTPNGTDLDTYANGYFEVQPGDTIYFEGWVKNSAGANGTGGLVLTFYDKDKANPTTSTSLSLPGTSYILKTLSATVPSGKYYVRASARVASGATSGTYYFDDFVLRRSNTSVPTILANSADSSAAFQIQSAGNANTLFTADTTNNILKVGDSTGSNTDTTILVLDSATANPTTLTSRDGGLFYRSDTNSIKAIVGGAVVDVCTTATVCSGYGASAGSVVSLQASSPGTQQTGNFNISGTGILSQLQTQDVSSSSTNSSNLTIRTGNATGTTSNSGNLILDTGTATGTLGTITIGHTGVATTMPGTLVVQGSNSLALGASSSAIGSIKLYNNVGSNTVTIAAAGSNPTSSWTFTLPQNPGSSGDCLKDSSGTGTLSFGNCTAGATTTLQDAYNNSSSPATITLANSKNLVFTAQDTSTDPNVLINLQCTTGCSTSAGRFAVQNGGTDVFTVLANNSGIVLAAATQIGSSTTDGTQVNFQLDSYNGSADSGTCTTTTNQGALYYNTTMASIRGCVNGSWADISNPDTLGLLTFGIIPSSGSNPYDLPALVTAGVSGPCKVSRVDNTHVAVQSCTAYSGGRRVNVSANSNLSLSSASLTTTNIWTHLCLDSSGSLTLTAAASTATANLTSIYPSSTYDISKPQLCLADIKGSTSSAGVIDDIYDVRTFTSTIKEAVNFTTAAELGMMADSSTSGLIPGATCTSGTCSGKLYGIVVSSDGSTSSSTPNGIVATVGPAYVKMTAGNSGEFIHDGPTTGYGVTVASVPNNAFYYSAGNARTAWSTTCTTAANCQASVYVNMLVR